MRKSVTIIFAESEDGEVAVVHDVRLTPDAAQRVQDFADSLAASSEDIRPNPS
jgi:hypothetical protein